MVFLGKRVAQERIHFAHGAMRKTEGLSHKATAEIKEKA